MTYRRLTVSETADKIVVKEGDESWIDLTATAKDFHENLDTGANNKINIGGSLFTITSIEEDYTP